MRALALLLLSALAACTPDFAAASDVTDLRVLAVQAEPPEAQFDDASVDPVQVRVLAIDPRDLGTIALRAWLCAPTDSLRCDQGQTLDLGILPLTTTLAVSPAEIALARASDDLKGLGGVRVQYSFSVDDGDPRGPVYGAKVLLYSPRGGTPNHNPGITGLQLSLEGAPFGNADAGGPLLIPKETQIGLRPVLAAGSREDYLVTDLRGNTVHLTEQPRYSFFVSPGAEMDRDTADEPLDGVAPPDGLARVTLHAAPATLWVVVRDGRGGEAWAVFALGEKPAGG